MAKSTPRSVKTRLKDGKAPAKLTSTTPAQPTGDAYLSALLEMKGSLGRVENAIEGIGLRLGSYDARFDRIDASINRINIILASSAAVVAVVVAFAGYLIDRKFDAILETLAR